MAASIEEQKLYQCELCSYRSYNRSEAYDHVAQHDQNNNGDIQSPIVELEELEAFEEDTPSTNVSNLPPNAVNRWSSSSVHHLLSLYQENRDKFGDINWTSKRIWTLISEEMQQKGYNVTQNQCDVKWRNMKKQYLKIKNNSKATKRKAVTWEFFGRMDEILGQRHEILGQQHEILGQQHEILSQRCDVPAPFVINNEVLVANRQDTPSPTTSSSATSQIISSATTSCATSLEVQSKDISLRKTRKRTCERPEWLQKILEAKRKRHEEKLTLHEEKLAIQEKQLALQEKKLALQEKKLALREKRLRDTNEFRAKLLDALAKIVSK